MTASEFSCDAFRRAESFSEVVPVKYWNGRAFFTLPVGELFADQQCCSVLLEQLLGREGVSFVKEPDEGRVSLFLRYCLSVPSSEESRVARAVSAYRSVISSKKFCEYVDAVRCGVQERALRFASSQFRDRDVSDDVNFSSLEDGLLGTDSHDGVVVYDHDAVSLTVFEYDRELVQSVAEVCIGVLGSELYLRTVAPSEKDSLALAPLECLAKGFVAIDALFSEGSDLEEVYEPGQRRGEYTLGLQLRQDRQQFCLTMTAAKWLNFFYNSREFKNFLSGEENTLSESVAAFLQENTV